MPTVVWRNGPSDPARVRILVRGKRRCYLFSPVLSGECFSAHPPPSDPSLQVPGPVHSDQSFVFLGPIHGFL